MSTVSVVVTYNCGNEYYVNFLSLYQQIDHVIIVDNGSDAATIECLKAIEIEFSTHVTFVYNPTNQGLAAAQNIGIKLAESMNCEWILLLDDDSTLAPDMVANMLSFYHNCNNPNVTILAPRLIERDMGNDMGYFLAKFKLCPRATLYGCSNLSVMYAIASGSLIKADLFKKIGYMNEEFFIDYIDIDFCLRVKQIGGLIIAVASAILVHKVGDKSLHKAGVVNVITSNHSALRRYYIYRNRKEVWRKYLRIFPRFVFYDIMAAVYDVLRIAIFEDNKREKLKQICRGLRA